MALIFPALVIFPAVVIAAVPWGLPVETTFVLPFITLLLVFLFAARRVDPAPSWLIFLAGLATDILTAGPLGFWALIYILTYTLARILPGKSWTQTIGGLWLVFLAAAVTAGAAGWAVASLYYFRVISWEPMALGIGAAIVLFPLASWVTRYPYKGRRGHRGRNGALTDGEGAII